MNNDAPFIFPVFEGWECKHINAFIGNSIMSGSVKKFEERVFTSIKTSNDNRKVFIDFVDEDIKQFSVEFAEVRYDKTYKLASLFDILIC